MKLLFFIGEFSEGGAERVISILANNLVNKGFDIEILKYYNSINFYKTDERIKITSVEENTKTKNKLANIKWARNYFKNNADIIISFLAVFNMYALVANYGNDVPIIVADRNDPRHMPNSWLLRLIRNVLYTKANAVIVQTNHNKDYFDSFIKDRCYVISNPIDMSKYVGSALKTEKENLIVSVGRLEPQKNQLMLINAFSEIAKKYDDYKLVIYGEGSYRKQLESRIKELNLENKVFLPGNEKDIFNKISKAKLFILCSNYEGMPNALIEAMCLGLPCISTKVSGATDIINGKNGKLIEIDNANQLINSIDGILSDSELALELANEASLINKEFEVTNICEKWIEIINKI